MFFLYITPHTVLERRALYFNSYKNRKLKVKLWLVGARERKKRTFLYRLFCTRGIFFDIRVLCQCIVYWMHLQNILLHTKKHYFMHFCCLFLKSSEAFIVSIIKLQAFWVYGFLGLIFGLIYFNVIFIFIIDCWLYFFWFIYFKITIKFSWLPTIFG